MTESELKQHPNVTNNSSNDLNVNLLPVLPRFSGINDSSASSTNESQKSGDSDAASSHCNSGSPAPQMARSFSQSNSENADPDVQASQRLACDPDIQEKIDLLEREKKVLQYHNQFLKVWKKSSFDFLLRIINISLRLKRKMLNLIKSYYCLKILNKNFWKTHANDIFLKKARIW